MKRTSHQSTSEQHRRLCTDAKIEIELFLHSKIAQRITLFQRSTAFLIKSLSVLSFLDVQDNKSRSVITILSEITRLL